MVLTCFHELGEVGEFAFGWWGHAIVFVGLVGGAGLGRWCCGVGAGGWGVVVFLEVIHCGTWREKRTALGDVSLRVQDAGVNVRIEVDGLRTWEIGPRTRCRGFMGEALVHAKPFQGSPHNGFLASLLLTEKLTVQGKLQCNVIEEPTEIKKCLGAALFFSHFHAGYTVPLQSFTHTRSLSYQR